MRATSLSLINEEDDMNQRRHASIAREGARRGLFTHTHTHTHTFLRATPSSICRTFLRIASTSLSLSFKATGDSAAAAAAVLDQHGVSNAARKMTCSNY